MANVKMKHVTEYDTTGDFNPLQYVDPKFLGDCIEYWIEIGKRENRVIYYTVVIVLVIIILLSTMKLYRICRGILC